MDLKDLTKKYVQKVQKLRDYIDQFFGKGWVGEKFDEPKKIMTREELDKIQKMKQEVDKIHAEWLEVIRSENAKE